MITTRAAQLMGLHCSRRLLPVAHGRWPAGQSGLLNLRAASLRAGPEPARRAATFGGGEPGRRLQAGSARLRKLAHCAPGGQAVARRPK